LIKGVLLEAGVTHGGVINLSAATERARERIPHSLSLFYQRMEFLPPITTSDAREQTAEKNALLFIAGGE